MKKALLLVGTLMAAACSDRGPAGDTGLPASGDTVTRDTAAAASRPLPVEALIRPDGIGEARRGMTIGDLRAALPPGVTLGTPKVFMVDIAAMSVIRGRDTLYHVLIISGEPATDDTPITLVGTMNTSFRTAEGVGPGTTLQEAARIYGAPSLNYNTNDESREYARFPRVPANILMRVAPSIEDGVFAGVYRTEGEFNETTEYDPAAVIAFVMVGLGNTSEDEIQ